MGGQGKGDKEDKGDKGDKEQRTREASTEEYSILCPMPYALCPCPMPTPNS